MIHNGLKFVIQRCWDAAQVIAAVFARIADFPSYKSMGKARYYYRMNVFKRISESWKERSYEHIRNRIHGWYNVARLRCLTPSVELIVCLVETAAGNAHSSRRSSLSSSAHFAIKWIVPLERGRRLKIRSSVTIFQVKAYGPFRFLRFAKLIGLKRAEILEFY